ncbi:hypothetical protein ACRN97_12265 [Shewanella baltica]|uniref:hypothetical protein n=1 Tax=Shewanella baltica TaxID=62322 RepID=UPI00217E608C|nr:hypothetical protein [Shewanella baltica]MCS6176743.1 hypothetical protein [Shewanella baltica]
MAIQSLLEQHAEIGDLMARSEQTKWPPDSLALAKQAAVKSHELAGKLLDIAAEFDARLTKLEETING